MGDYFIVEGNQYYSNLVNTIKITAIKERLDTYDLIDPIDKDEIMLQYIKCRPECFVITIWPIAMGKLLEIVNYLNKKGNIYYVKEVTLTKEGLRNLMFSMYDEFTMNEKLIFIEKKLEYINAKPHDNLVGFIIFDNVQNHKLAGQGSLFKKEIRNTVSDLIKDTNSNNVWGNDLVHINDHFYQTIEYCQIILNNNSLHLLNNQDVRKFVSVHMKESHFKLQTFRKWIYENMGLLEQTKLCLMGGTVLYAYGIRKSNDIDGIIVIKGNKEEDIELMQASYEDLLVAFQLSEEKKEELQRALKKLTKKQLEIIKLKFFENLSCSDIAAKTSLAPRTVYNLIYEALRHLRDVMHLVVFIC